jgi:hypothetical protein
MFASQKNNAFTASTQSSVDSLVTSKSTSTSVSDVGASQSSEHSSYGEPHSPEQRIGPTSGRRHSVFTLRSRSNTATSTTSYASPSSPNMSAHDASSSRSIFKSKKGKRSSGSFSHHSHTHDNDEPQVGTRRSSMLRKTKKPAEQPESSGRFISPHYPLLVSNESSANTQESHLKPLRLSASHAHQSAPFRCPGRSL